MTEIPRDYQLKSGSLLEKPYYPFMKKVVDILLRYPRHVLFLEPESTDAFECSSCGHCCQRPWFINIEKPYYDKWFDVFDQDPSGLYKNPLLIKEDATDKHYAEIRRKPGTSECIFLEDDKKCFIHKKYGLEALSFVCRTYPRYEGWFGSYLGKFLMNSCPDVPALLHNTPDIRYSIGILSQDKWQAYGLLYHPLGMFQGYLWLGLQLDLIQESQLSPLQSLRYLGQALKQFILPQTAPYQAELFEQIHVYFQDLNRPGTKHLPLRTEFPAAMELIFELLKDYKDCCEFIRETLFAGLESLELRVSEQNLLNAFIKQYLGYRFLNANYYVENQLTFFYQYYYGLSIQMVLLQWLAFYYREQSGQALSSEHLMRATNLIGYRFENSQRMIDICKKFTPHICLEGLDILLSFDCGLQT